MSEAVIHVEGLGKRYRRGTANRAESLYEAATRIVRFPLRALCRERQEEFWALRDVSLDVKQGEVLGLIGRNGAGKTTLLKLLSRITRPTTGWAEIHGRVRSLLEVGTGFHAELTGRENTYLSGSILGMSKREIDRKFDEIVAFAEIDRFIDTPVKHYSSGMYVRLAFAVAAHLEPEILLVDEVLAVGDINFQKKCLGKLGDVAREGRTVVLVTHHMNQIRRLSQRVAWIDAGVIRCVGPTHEAVGAYEIAMRSRDEVPLQRAEFTREKARFLFWDIDDGDPDAQHQVDSLDPITIRFHLIVHRPIQHGVHGINLYDSDRRKVWGNASYNLLLQPGEYYFSYKFPCLPLRPGPYSWVLSIYDDEELLDCWNATPEMIVATESYQHPRDDGAGWLNLKVQFSPVAAMAGSTAGASQD